MVPAKEALTVKDGCQFDCGVVCVIYHVLILTYLYPFVKFREERAVDAGGRSRSHVPLRKRSSSPPEAGVEVEVEGKKKTRLLTDGYLRG